LPMRTYHSPRANAGCPRPRFVPRSGGGPPLRPRFPSRNPIHCRIRANIPIIAQRGPHQPPPRHRSQKATIPEKAGEGRRPPLDSDSRPTGLLFLPPPVASTRISVVCFYPMGLLRPHTRYPSHHLPSILHDPNTSPLRSVAPFAPSCPPSRSHVSAMGGNGKTDPWVSFPLVSSPF